MWSNGRRKRCHFFWAFCCWKDRTMFHRWDWEATWLAHRGWFRKWSFAPSPWVNTPSRTNFQYWVSFESSNCWHEQPPLPPPFEPPFPNKKDEKWIGFRLKTYQTAINISEAHVILISLHFKQTIDLKFWMRRQLNASIPHLRLLQPPSPMKYRSQTKSHQLSNDVQKQIMLCRDGHSFVASAHLPFKWSEFVNRIWIFIEIDIWFDSKQQRMVVSLQNGRDFRLRWGQYEWWPFDVEASVR